MDRQLAMNAVPSKTWYAVMKDGTELALSLYPDDWVCITTVIENSKQPDEIEFHSVFLPYDKLAKVIKEMEETNHGTESARKGRD